MADGFKILDAYVEVRADASNVGADAERQIRNQGHHLSNSGKSLGDKLGEGMKAGFAGLVGGLVAGITAPLVQGVGQAIDQVMATAKYAIFDYNTLLENANIGFTTMLGSGAKATKMLDDLQAFAAKTPFEFSDLTLASQRLIAMGIHAKDVIPTMTAIGDAVAGLGGDKGTIDQITTALGQMTAKGKIQGDELMQLTEAGIPALKILADTYGVSTGKMQDMISKGQVLADRAVPAIVRGLEKGTKTTAGFGGMMEKQSKTMSGSLSNIQDSINQTISKAFLPMFKIVERVAGGLAKFAGSKEVQRWAKDTAKELGGFFTQVEKGVKVAFGDPKVRKAMEDFGKTFTKAMKDSGPELKKVIPDLAKFAKESLPGIIDGAGKLVKALPELAKDLHIISKDLSRTGKDFGGFASAVGGTVGAVLGFLDNIDQGWLDFTRAFHRWRDDTIGALGKLSGDFQRFGYEIVTGLIIGITQKFGEAVQVAQDLAKNIGDAFAKVLGIQSPSKVFQQYGTWVAQGLHKGLLGSIDQIKSAGAALADAVDKPMRAGVERTTRRLVDLAKRRDKVVDQLSAAKDALTDLRFSRDDYRANVRSNILGAGNLVDLYGLGSPATSTTTTVGASAGSLDGRAYTGSYTSSSTVTTPAVSGIAMIKSRLRQMIRDTKKFTANLKQLVKMGLYSDLFQQLVSAGPTAGLALTNELLADKASFQEINTLGKRLATVGNLLGDYSAGVTYDGQIKSTQRMVNGLRDQRDNITAVMVIEARKIDEVDKVVKAVNALAKTAKAKKAATRKVKR